MRLTIGVCALAAFGSAASAQQPGDSLRLSRRQAIAEALNHNAQLEVAREQTAQSRARRVTAIAVPDPALTASYDQQPGFLNLGGAGARNVGIGMLVPFPDKFRLRNNVALGDIGANVSNYHLQQELIAFQTSQAYDSLLLAMRHRSDLVEDRALSADFLKKTQARFNAGTAAKLDVIRAQTDLAQSDNSLIGNERDFATAEAALNHLLGRPVSTPIAATDSLDLPPALPDSAAIERLALDARPELAGLQSQQRGAKANTSLIKEFWIPDFTLGVSHDYTQPGSPVFSTGIALPLPVFYWQHARGDIAEAQHHERELAAAYRDLSAQVAQDVRTSYANASTNIRQVIFLRDQLVPSAREAYRVASVSYALGGLSALEVLDARRTLIAAESQLAEALAAANIARADLERALGTPIVQPGVRTP